MVFLTLPTLTPATDPLLILRPLRRPTRLAGGAAAGSAWPLAEAAAAAAAAAALRWRPGRSRAVGSPRGEGGRRRRPTWGLGARPLIIWSFAARALLECGSFSRTVLNCYGFFYLSSHLFFLAATGVSLVFMTTSSDSSNPPWPGRGRGEGDWAGLEGRIVFFLKKW